MDQSIVFLKDNIVYSIDFKALDSYLRNLPVLERFNAINDMFRGSRFGFGEPVSRAKSYSIEGAPLDATQVIEGLRLYSLDEIDGRVPLIALLEYVWQNFSSCFHPTAAVLGYVQEDVFTVLGFGSNTIMDIPRSGRYYVKEADKYVEVEYDQETRLVPYTPKCPRYEVLDASTGRLYRLCRFICKQAGHSEVMAVLQAGLGEVINDPNSEDETYRIKANRYEGPGTLTMLFLGHWWFCENCTNAMQQAGVRQIVLVTPERFKK